MTNQTRSLIRLNKYLASIGLGSRRYCEGLIQRSEVLVNGEIARLGMKVDPGHDWIEINERGRISSHQSKLHYLIVYKPSGFITTMSDPQGRPTIRELIPSIGQRVYPVGRLDFQSEGIIVLTNDGALAHILMHPSSMISKCYLVKIKGRPEQKVLNTLKQGIELDDGQVSVDAIGAVKSHSSANSWYKVTIHEGKNRVIRRMFEAIGHPVLRLKRVSIAGIGIGTLKPGEWRYLTQKEIKRMQDACRANDTSKSKKTKRP